jgi:hypothetical protein
LLKPPGLSEKCFETASPLAVAGCQRRSFCRPSRRDLMAASRQNRTKTARKRTDQTERRQHSGLATRRKCRVCLPTVRSGGTVHSLKAENDSSKGRPSWTALVKSRATPKLGPACPLPADAMWSPQRPVFPVSSRQSVGGLDRRAWASTCPNSTNSVYTGPVHKGTVLTDVSCQAGALWPRRRDPPNDHKEPRNCYGRHGGRHSGWRCWYSIASHDLLRLNRSRSRNWTNEHTLPQCTVGTGDLQCPFPTASDVILDTKVRGIRKNSGKNPENGIGQANRGRIAQGAANVSIDGIISYLDPTESVNRRSGRWRPGVHSYRRQKSPRIRRCDRAA